MATRDSWNHAHPAVQLDYHCPARPGTSQIAHNHIPPRIPTSRTSPAALAFDAQEFKQPRPRITRACDACRRMKIRCVFPPDFQASSCGNCKANRRKCCWDNLGVKRERPPTKSDVEHLNLRIETLEKVMSVLAPHIDLTSLPRTAEQARTIVGSTGRLVSEHVPNKPIAKADGTQVSDYQQVYHDMAELHLTPVEYLKEMGPDAPAAIQKPWQRVNESGEPDLESLMVNDQRSIAERCMERHHFRNAAEEQNYPPADLAKSLIELYFQKVHPYECILHRGEFMQHYNKDLAQQDCSFRALCYAVFAAASRFSSDYRVVPPSDGSNVGRQSVGALYGAASASFITPVTLPCTLFDLQAMAVLSYFLIGTCSPMTAWFSICIYLRRAQDVGAHLANTPRFDTSVLKDQLRKRAFFYLFGRELQLCLSLGRASCIRRSLATIEHPFIVDDGKLSRFCEENSGKTLDIAYKRSQLSQGRLANAPCWIANQACYALRSKFGAQLKMLWSVKSDPERTAWDWDRSIVKQIAQAIDKHIKYDVPAGARWNPDANNEPDLILTARLRCLVSYFQIAVHRHLISTDSSELKVCLDASSTMLDVLDHLKSRGVLELTATYTPYFITPAALTFLYAACVQGSSLSTPHRASAWADVHRCINVLATLAPTTFQAEKLKASLDHLVKTCIDEQLFPGSTPLGKKLKRGSSDITTILSITPAITIGENLSEDPQHASQGGGSLSDNDAPRTGGSAPVSPNSDDVTDTTPPALELFNVPAPQLDAEFFQYPGKGLEVSQRPFVVSSDRFHPPSSMAFATPEWIGKEFDEVHLSLPPNQELSDCLAQCQALMNSSTGLHPRLNELMPASKRNHDPGVL